MKTLILLSLISLPAFAYDDWWTRNAIEQAAQTQANATRQAAQIQADAIASQTKAMESQAQSQSMDMWLANQQSYKLQMMQLALAAQKAQAQAEPQCEFRLLVKDLKTMEPLVFVMEDGRKLSNLYFKDCSQAKDK